MLKTQLPESSSDSMSATAVGISVAEWLRPVGYGYRELSNDEIEIASEGGEIRFYVRYGGGQVVVSRAERSGDEYTTMATASFNDAERFLTRTLGQDLRSQVVPTAPRLRLPWTSGSVADGFTIVEASQSYLPAVVLESGRERARFADFQTPYAAVQFTHYANIPIADLRASLLDASGRPSLVAYVQER
jgi:hypothetical protein